MLLGKKSNGTQMTRIKNRMETDQNSSVLVFILFIRARSASSACHCFI